MAIYLVRHGATDWAIAGRHTGRTDIPLNAQGEEQARSLIGRLATLSFNQVFVSPLVRAQRTALLAGVAQHAVTTDLLYEVDYGEDEGRTSDEIRRDRPGWDFWRDGPQGGEPLTAVAERTQRCLDLAAAQPGNTLLVAHGHVLRILASRFLQASLDWGRHLVLGTASLSCLGQEQHSPAILLWNEQVPARR